MADSRDAMKKELDALIKQGEAAHLLLTVRWVLEHQPETELDDETKRHAEEFEFAEAYQRWYSRALRVVEQLLPDRYAEFRELYRLDRPAKDVHFGNYSISQFLAGVSITRYGEPVFDTHRVAMRRVGDQLNILRSAQDRLDSRLADIKGVLEADVFDDELGGAEDLRKKKYPRAAGVVAGVVLERHLKRVCANHGIKLRKKSPTISDLNDALKNAEVYDTPRWREIQRLGDIRNYAGHDKERDPTEEEVMELIRGTEKVIKTVF